MWWMVFWLSLADSLDIQPSVGSCRAVGGHLKCLRHLPRAQQVIAGDIHTLELRDIDWDVVDLNVLLERFPNIQNVSISGGNITTFALPRLRNNTIKILQLNQLQVENIGGSFLTHFPQLETLNLQDNHLQGLGGNFSTGNLKNLYLSDNRWNCSLDLTWVYRLDQRIVKDLDNLTCYGEPHSGKPLKLIANFLKEIKAQCPEVCACSLPKVVRDLNTDEFQPMVEVNCSYRGLTELPRTLPNGKTILKLENNEIEDLAPLKQNLMYRRIVDLYLDNNKISSIEELEGSYFLRHFRVFSLSGNKITELPTYALDNALEQNINMPKAVRMSLGGNPWRCDCVFTPVFQEMLQKFAPQIEDISEVKCSYVEGDENSLLPIVELSRSSVCRLPAEYSVQALDLLNAVLASLILLILGKLAYDYYYFKKTGRLPWIVTKMP